MKLQNNGLKVSVGAGFFSSYLSIDEFVDYYLPIELKNIGDANNQVILDAPNQRD